jgi:Rrf2 family protein
MLSQTAEYALRAVVYLASSGDAPCVAQDIAKATRVPSGYLSKVLQGLVREKLVTSRRGLRGGFALARPASRISVLDVLAATDNPLQRITECPLGIGGHQGLCPVHRFVDEAIAELQKKFRRVTIEELVFTTRGEPPLCVVGRAARRSPSRSGRRAGTGKKAARR